MRVTRRDWLRVAAGGVVVALTPRLAAATELLKPVKITVYKSPTCGCCKGWVDHVREAGFEVVTHDVGESAREEVKATAGISSKLRSCHTGLVGKYAVEGHVPADVIKQLLKEAPKVAGIAVPGMPIGSPGMEVPGRKADKYDIIAFDRSGKTRVFASR